MITAWLATASIGCGAIDDAGAGVDVGEGEDGDAQASVGDEHVGSAALPLTSLNYSTYLGGAGEDAALGSAVDSSGNVYLVGTTTSYGVGGDVFVSKLSPTGGLIYYVYFGGPRSDGGYGIAVDSAGNAYVTGETKSYSASGDIFVAKLNPAGSALLHYAYFGGSGHDSGESIAIDSAGNAYVTGWTGSTNFPATLGAFQTTLRGPSDAFVAKLNAAGNTLLYSTYLGGDDGEVGNGIAIDAYGYAYVTGDTTSLNGVSPFPTTPGAFRTTAGGGTRDAFVTELVPSGSSLYYSTYLGGSAVDHATGIAVDGSFNAYVTGATQSTDFPTTPGAFRTSNGGEWDGFVTQLNAAGSATSYSTYVGGSLDDYSFGIAVNSSGNAYVAGTTYSTDFPTFGATQPSYGGGVHDAFALKISGP